MMGVFRQNFSVRFGEEVRDAIIWSGTLIRTIFYNSYATNEQNILQPVDVSLLILLHCSRLHTPSYCIANRRFEDTAIVSHTFFNSQLCQKYYGRNPVCIVKFSLVDSTLHDISRVGDISKQRSWSQNILCAKKACQKQKIFPFWHTI